MADANPFRKVDENPFRAEDVERTTGASQFSDTTLRGLMDNLLGVPRGTGELLAMAGAATTTGRGGFQERLAAERTKAPASGVFALADILPESVTDIQAGFKSIPSLLPGGTTPGEAFAENTADIEAQLAARAGQEPFATGAGEVAGDVLTLVGGRAPIAGKINKLETALMNPAVRNLPPGFNRFAARIIDSPAMRKTARGAGRTLETGAEAAVLDILKGDDPLETAAYAAATQGGGSLLLTAGKGLLSGGVTKAGIKIATSAFAFGSLLQILDTAAPGAEESFIKSVQTGYDKVTLALVLGAVAGMTGSGRLRGGKLADDLPVISDAIATIPRAAVVSMLEQFVDADPETQEQARSVMSKLVEDPEFFGPQNTERLAKAIENGTFLDEIRGLQKDDTFKQRLFSMAPPTLAVPRGIPSVEE